MNNPLIILAFLYTISAFGSLQAQETPGQKAERMAWFAEAKLGIFIHWGIYAVNGIDESWSFYNGYISYPDYMKQLDGFTAANYEPARWADLIAGSGARYAVLTSKHHDGVALWDTEFSELDVVGKTPAGRDLITPYMKAIRKKGLKAGLYFSQLDWSHPDYPHFTREDKRYESDSARWERFLEFNRNQLLELCNSFKPDLIWFDGDWDYSAEQWNAKELSGAVRECNPEVILNSRINGYGDYGTPEQGVPIHRPADTYWELCMTMNDSWGYQGNDNNYKSTNQVIRIFSDVIGMGGNLLLDIGPMADGTIPAEQVEIMEGLGRWTAKHKDAIYGTTAGLPPGYFNGPSTLSLDSTMLYLFMEYAPRGPVLVKGIRNKINRIWVEGNGTKLDWDIKMKQYWSPVPALLYIDVPDDALDEEVTVISILLEGKLDIYGDK